MVGRCNWIPLSMEHLVEARDRAKAAGDEETLALLREISRLHWILLTTNQIVSFIDGAYFDKAKAGAKELRQILDREPLIVKRKADWARDFATAKADTPARRPKDSDR